MLRTRKTRLAMDQPSSGTNSDRIAVGPAIMSEAMRAAAVSLAAETTDSRLPLVIGVTGHRDLHRDAWAEVSSHVREILLQLRTTYPSTPLLVLSPLAEGGDRLLAEVALEPQIAARLMVPMPMPRALYERDFKDAASRADFARLLAAASHSIELPLAPRVIPEEASDDHWRQSQYVRVGEFIARYSQILIALWDGKSGDIGGTASVVQLKLTGNWPNPPEDAPFEGIVPTGPVYHVTTPRLLDGSNLPKVISTEIYPDRDGHQGEPSGEQTAGDIYSFRVLKPLDDYNREVINSPGAAAAAERAANDLIPSLDNPALRDVRAGLEVMREQYAMADVLAGQYHAKTVSTLFWVSVIVFFAALGFDAALHLLVGEGLGVVRAISMFSSPVMMLAAIFVYRRAKRNDYQNKFQDYRGLAEGLRIQFFWRLAGLDECVADHYLGRHRWELEWIRNACRSSQIAANAPLGPVNEETRRLVQDCWVEPQRSYLENSIHRQERRIEKFELGLSVCFWAGLAAILGLSLLIGMQARHASDLLDLLVGEDSPLHGMFLTLITMSAVVAALVHNYVEKLALKPQIRMYEGMKHIYQRYADKLRSASAKIYLALLFKLGEEALMENGDWIMTHRERPLEIPHH
jgi:hypothetical protein